jgi:hypothetical protein
MIPQTPHTAAQLPHQHADIKGHKIKPSGPSEETAPMVHSLLDNQDYHGSWPKCTATAVISLSTERQCNGTKQQRVTL